MTLRQKNLNETGILKLDVSTFVKFVKSQDDRTLAVILE